MALPRAFFDRSTPARLGVAVLLVSFGAVVAGALFVWIAPFRGPVHSVELARDSIPLRVAGANPLFTVAYIGVGLVRLYLTTIPLALFVGGIAVVLTDRRWAKPVAVVLGSMAAGTLTVLTGCHCASGSTALLAERALWAIVDGTVSLLV